MKKIYYEFASSHGMMSQMIVDPHIYYVGCSSWYGKIIYNFLTFD